MISASLRENQYSIEKLRGRAKFAASAQWLSPRAPRPGMTKRMKLLGWTGGWGGCRTLLLATGSTAIGACRGNGDACRGKQERGESKVQDGGFLHGLVDRGFDVDGTRLFFDG